MAVDKLVDSGKLDACCAAEAAAIIAKGGGTAPLAYDFANNKGFADAIDAIPSGGAGGNYNIESVDDGNGGQILNITDAQGGTEITDGIVVKARDANGKPTAADFYISVLDVNLLGEPDGRSRYWLTELTTANFINPITDIEQCGLCFNSKLTGSYTFYVNGLNYQRTIYQCVALEGLSLPECAYIGPQCVQNMSSLKTLYAPKCTSYANVENGYAPFVNCTALETVQLGSIGYSVGVLGKTSGGVMKSFVFNGCTQAGLTITLYCKGTEADTLLANVRGNATNATIIIKASENTTYNGTAYAAGETMITSEVA